jgi:predicted nucleic acid-binding protein
VKVVSGSSPLITLAKIEQLELLPQLYGRIAITPQVYREVVVGGEGLAGSSEIKAAKWIDVESVGNADDLAEVQQVSGLGIGELSAIQLGRETRADLVLLDETKARKIALGHGLTVLGCVGILEDAFGLRLLTDLRKTYQGLLAAGAYVDPRILENSLKSLNLPLL